VKNRISISLHDIKKKPKTLSFQEEEKQCDQNPHLFKQPSKKKTTFQKERTEPTTILIS
jgi:hypothetical protein